MPHLRLDQYLSALLCCLMLLFVPGMNTVQLWQPTLEQHTDIQSPQLNLISPVIVPIPKSTVEEKTALSIALTAESIYVMDRGCGCVLFEKAATKALYPASTAKLLTALVSRKLYDLDDIVTITSEVTQVEGTTAHLKIGEQFQVRDLLAALLVSSGNDAAVALALHYPQSGNLQGNDLQSSDPQSSSSLESNPQSSSSPSDLQRGNLQINDPQNSTPPNNNPQSSTGFVQAMNTLAKELHLSSSQFENPSGLDSPTQFVTARDMAILANEVMKDQFLRQLVNKQSFAITDLAGHAYTLTNTHELLGVVPGVVGIKTGTTAFAGENLITEVDRDGHQIIFVVLNSRDRYGDTKTLIDWVFRSYTWQEIDRSSVDRSSIDRGDASEVH